MQVFRWMLPDERGALRTLLLTLRVMAWATVACGVLVLVVTPFVLFGQNETSPFAASMMAVVVLMVAGLGAGWLWWTNLVFRHLAEGRPDAHDHLLAYALFAAVVGALDVLRVGSGGVRFTLPLLLVLGILLLIKRSEWLRERGAPAMPQAPQQP